MIVEKRKIFFYIVMISLVPFIWIGRVPAITYGIHIIKFAICIIGGLYLIKRIASGAISNYYVALFGCFCWIVITTVIHKGVLADVLTYSYILFALVILDSCCASDAIDFINTLEKFLSLIITVNLLLMILFPGGLYYDLQDRYHYVASIRYNMLGYDNQLSTVIIPYTGLLLFMRYNNLHNRFRYNCMIGVVALTGILAHSMTLKILLVLIVLMYWLIKSKRIQFSFSLVFWIILAAVFFIVVIQSFNLLSFFIQDILGKSMTLSNRTLIWSEALKLIKSEFVMGYGLTGTDNMIFLDLSQDYRSAHDMYLQLMLRGGIPYLFFHLYLIKKADFHSSESSIEMSLRILQISILAFMIGMASEVLNLNFLYIIIFAVELLKENYYEENN